MLGRRLVFALVITTACASPAPATTTPTTAPATTTTTSEVTPSPPRANGTNTTEPAPAPCATGNSFATEGTIGTVGSAESSATGVASVRWADHGSCERIVIHFADGDGAPADLAGVTDASFVAGRRIIRVRLGSEVQTTAVADVVIDNPLATRAYVVRGLDGNLFIDVHLGAAASSRVFTLDEPGRIVVDLRRGGEPPAAAGVHGDTVVVTEPRPLEGVSGPVRVAGYARTFEATVTVVATRAGTQLAEATTTAADWAATWGEFAVAVTVGELGPIGLTVGSVSPATGEFDGVRLTIEVI